MPPILALEQVYYTYADGTEALSNISLEVNPHEIFVLFGPARSGKSTLLRLLNRLSDLDDGARMQGKVLFNGADIFQHETNVTDLRRAISMVFAIPTPLPGSIYDNLVYGPKMAGIRDKEELDRRVIRSLQQAALWEEVQDRLDSSAFALSWGQKQRLCWPAAWHGAGCYFVG
ncbi:MAG: ATP-binding cassette domain-containing protein [Caldilineaceae bacterium]